MADRIRKTETSQGISNQGGLMNVIFNSYSGKVKTTRGQCVLLSHQNCRKPEEKTQSPCWTHLTRPHGRNAFLVGGETTEGTGNGTVLGGVGSVVTTSYSAVSSVTLVSQPYRSLTDVGAWQCVFRDDADHDQAKSEKEKHERANVQTAQESWEKVTPEKESSTRSAKVF